jgi:NTE family protein
VAGTSIGAINAALIAGNPPARRIARLRAFWDLVSTRAPTFSPFPAMELWRPWLNRMSAASAAAFGIVGLDAPRVPAPALR